MLKSVIYAPRSLPTVSIVPTSHALQAPRQSYLCEYFHFYYVEAFLKYNSTQLFQFLRGDYNSKGYLYGLVFIPPVDFASLVLLYHIALQLYPLLNKKYISAGFYQCLFMDVSI